MFYVLFFITILHAFYPVAIRNYFDADFLPVERFVIPK